jgi:hypothetical protein
MQAGGYAIQHTADCSAVRFAERGEAPFIAKCIHSCGYNYSISLLNAVQNYSFFRKYAKKTKKNAKIFGHIKKK